MKRLPWLNRGSHTMSSSRAPPSHVHKPLPPAASRPGLGFERTPNFSSEEFPLSFKLHLPEEERTRTMTISVDTPFSAINGHLNDMFAPDGGRGGTAGTPTAGFPAGSSSSSAGSGDTAAAAPVEYFVWYRKPPSFEPVLIASQRLWESSLRSFHASVEALKTEHLQRVIQSLAARLRDGSNHLAQRNAALQVQALGTYRETKAMLSVDLLSALVAALGSPDNDVRGNAAATAWDLASNVEHRQQLVDDLDIVNVVISEENQPPPGLESTNSLGNQRMVKNIVGLLSVLLEDGTEEGAR